MRRRTVLLAALALILALPGSASAGRATKLTDRSVNLYCDGIHPTAGTGFAYFGAFASDLNGSDAFLDAWTVDDPAGAAEITRDYEQPADVTWDGSVLQGSFAVVDDTGTAIGSAAFSATMTPVGDPYPIDETFRDGNQQNRASGSGQALQPAGALTLPGGTTFDLAACAADTSTISVFATNPNAYVSRFVSRSVACDLSDAAGDTGYLFVDLGDTEVFLDAGVFPADPASPSLFATISGAPIGDTFDAELDLYLEDGTPAGVSGSVHLTLTATHDRYEVLLRDGTQRRLSGGTLIDVGGSLTLGAITFDLSSCVGTDGWTKHVRTNPQGPRPGGKVPANDLPSGAKLMAPGASSTTQTKGASPDREAPYECLFFEDVPGEIVELPVGYTVWYKIRGTGAAVTVDTAGSDFDTVAAVYTANDSGDYVPIAEGCVDDVPTQPFGRTLQAAVTFPTSAGVTYYVQIGGFPGLLPYGTLKVAVR